MRDPHPRDRRDERGVVMVLVALGMVALLLFAALAVDVGAVWMSRTQSQNADDAAALATAQAMIVKPGSGPFEVDRPAAIAKGKLIADANKTVANPKVKLRDEDFTFGTWDLVNRELVELSGSDLDDPNLVTGVRVAVVMNGAADANKRSPSLFSRLAGLDGFEVTNTATAYLGFEGTFAEEEFDLPIAIDACKISAGGCGTDFCQIVEEPLNTCDLEWDQGPGDVSCLEFASNPEQNACWTLFDGGSSSVNSDDLIDLIDDHGNQGTIESGDEVFLDNGTKESALKHLRDRFYGCRISNSKDCGEHDPQGTNRYSPDPPGSPDDTPEIDSWVVKLPVFGCHAGLHCSGGGAKAIEGAVCFEIREILAPAGDYASPHSEAVIKGRFLCPDSDDEQVQQLWNEHCRDADDGQSDSPGGCNYGFRADKVVLVQ